ncbi:MAG TPA: hypothetical protein PK400_03770 [Phycisphaerales bacterium]|nr:hypothetical protein [Phycisphaerales bacterium]HRQ75021.1 hypothetical protein [Phycisphaerales bacterium]
MMRFVCVMMFCKVALTGTLHTAQAQPPDETSSLSEQIDALEAKIIAGQTAGRPQRGRTVQLPMPLTRSDFGWYVEVLELDLTAHAHLLEDFRQFQLQMIALQEKHLPAIWRSSGDLSQHQYPPRELMQKNELHIKLESDYRSDVATAEDTLIAAMMSRAPEHLSDEHRNWVHADRLRARHVQHPGIGFPGSGIDLVLWLRKNDVGFTAHDAIGEVVRDYVLTVGPLSKRCHESRVESNLRSARLEFELLPHSPDVFVERRSAMLRRVVALDQDKRDANVDTAKRLAKLIDPERGEKLLEHVQSNSYPELYPDRIRSELISTLAAWRNRDGWDDAESAHMNAIVQEYEAWYQRQTGELEAYISAWFERWHSTFAGSIDDEAEYERVLDDFRAEHQERKEKLIAQLQEMWTMRERPAP